MADISSPKTEVRFAVVMYGGVSLAIYMNGIAQELLRMVRATATRDSDNNPLIDYRDLDPVEVVYRKLAYCSSGRLASDMERKLLESNAPLTRTFTIDIVSGTSAGGINGIFLAKALANGQNMDELKNLWITEGDVNLLLNDKNSVKKTGLKLQKEPASLFNSRRMYQKLLTAFKSMEKPGAGGGSAMEESGNSYVREIDLFVTATDILGLTLPIKLSDATVYERKHRTVFRFSFSRSEPGDPPWNDFASRYNPMLAFAARCTSSFPFAFEPMRLSDINEVLDSMKYGDDSYAVNRRWRRFFKNYPDVSGNGTVPYPDRSFGDGGYLDNKPFTYAIDAIAERRSDYPVDRKLLYIEPVPEHPELEVENAGKPDAIENTMDALLKLPRYETIREDLEKIFERNRLIERVDRMIKNLERDKTVFDENNGSYQKWQPAYSSEPEPLWASSNLSDEEWGRLDLTEMTMRKGPGYVAYHRLEIAVVTDDFSRLLTRVAGFDEETDYSLVFRYLLRAWREMNYCEYRESGSKMPTMNGFLHAFDLGYPMRRLKFLLRQIDRLYLLDQNEHGKEIENYFKWIDPKSVASGGMPQVSVAWSDEFRAALLVIKREINVQLNLMTKAGRELRSRFAPPEDRSEKENPVPPSPIYALVSQLVAKLVESPEIEEVKRENPAAYSSGDGQSGGQSRKKEFEPVIDYFLGQSRTRSTVEKCREADELDGEAKARCFLDLHKEFQVHLSMIGDVVESRLKPVIEASDNRCREVLATDNVAESSASAVILARSMIRAYYRKYGDFDMIIFPVTYGTAGGEGGIIDVARVSPEDAKLLIDERSCRLRKLAGTSLGNFGAFMEKRWRQNDIMWGQLDGAERIISALMPDREAAKTFTGEAQAAIVLDTIASMGQQESMDLLVEPFMRPDNDQPDPESLSKFTGALKQNAGEGVRKKLEEAFSDKALRDHYLTIFPKNKSLDPEGAFRNAARATSVTGKILTGIANQKNLSGKKYIPLVTTSGRFFLWLVEAAIPRSFLNLVTMHWLKLLYLFEVVLFFGGFVFVNDSVQRFAITAFGLTASVHIALSWLNSLIMFRKSWSRLLKSLGAFLVILLLVSGLVFLYALFGFQDQWWSSFQDLHDWVKSLSVAQVMSYLF
ncbi:MAG: patatin-like protein [Chlorobiaceae bacterium]|nr:patatin-like protein [Chlorobiaceae bacterium]